MQLEFKAPTYWSDFYSHYGINQLTPVNESGWANFQCILPFHPSRSKSELKGSINLWDGRYKCWSGSCQDIYRQELDLPPTRESLSASEFLVLTQKVDLNTAEQIVESFRLSAGVEDIIDTFTDTFSPRIEWEEYIRVCQKNLTPTLDIVQQYMNSRGLEFKTLQGAGIGYDPGPPEWLVFPYYQGGIVVGIRGRGFDGKKSGVKGAYMTLFQPPPPTSRSRVAILCEGETDTLIVRQILNHQGFSHVPVSGSPGNFFKAEWARHFHSFSRVILIAQSDLAGRQLIQHARRCLPQLEVVIPPFPSQSHGKDISDFCRLSPSHESELFELLGLSSEDIPSLPYLIPLGKLLSYSQKPIPWIVPGLIERGTKNLIVGDPKSLKTWISLNLMKAVTCQSAFMGVRDWTPTSYGTALLIEEEGSLYRLADRFHRLFEDELNFERRVFTIFRQRIQLDLDESLSHLRKEILRLQPDIVIFDPYANFHCQDENSVQGTMTVMKAFNSLLYARPEMAIVIIHHSSKGVQGVRGSSSIWGSMDLKIQVSKVDGGVRFDSILGRDLPDLPGNTQTFLFNSERGSFSYAADFHIRVIQPSQTSSNRQTSEPAVRSM